MHGAAAEQSGISSFYSQSGCQVSRELHRTAAGPARRPLEAFGNEGDTARAHLDSPAAHAHASASLPLVTLSDEQLRRAPERLADAVLTWLAAVRRRWTAGQAEQKEPVSLNDLPALTLLCARRDSNP